MARLTLDKSSTHLLLYTEPLEAGLVKRIHGYFYDFKQKCWTFVLTRENLRKIRLVFNGRLTIDKNIYLWALRDENRTGLLKQLKEAEKVDLPENLTPKIKPFAHQTVGIKFILSFKQVLLLDEMGLGKSAQALCSFVSAKNAGEVDKCLIICPKSLLYNWTQEVEKHTDLTYCVISGTKKQRLSLLKDTKSPVIITGYDTVRVHRDENIFQELANNQFLIIDEATYIKNMRAKRTKSIFDITAKYKALLTGTPIMNKPEDCYSLIQSVKPTWKHWWEFEDAYITKVISRSSSGKIYDCSMSYKNLDDLRLKLESVSLRRLKTDCLDLPPKVFEDRVVDMTEVQQKKYDICLNELRLEFSNCTAQEYNKKQMSILTKIIRLNQISDGFLSDGKQIEFIDKSGKFTELDEIIDILKQKIVIWCNFIPLIKYLGNKYSGRSVIFYGDMNDKERADAIKKWKEEQGCELFIGQVRTGGMGLNLTEAQAQVFFDLPMTPGEYSQAVDRLHRIGTRGTVSVIHLLSKNSIDLKFKQSLVSKMELISKVIGEKPILSGYRETKDLLGV